MTCLHPDACKAKTPGRLCRGCNIRRLNADPEFAAQNVERGRERMRRLNADPEFAAQNVERGRERMRRLNADPEFAAQNAERGRERMRRLHAERRGFDVPEHLREMYLLARRKGFGPKAALRLAERSSVQAAE